MSLFLKHIYSYREIINKYNEVLIFEDDIILSDNFVNKLNNYISQLPNNFDMLFIGDGCNLHIQSNKIQPNINVYEKCLYKTDWGGNGCTRCCDSYIVSKKCAIKIINNLKYQINLPIDHWLNIIALENNFNVYWAEPTIVTQGSENGIYKSSLR